MRVGCSTDKKAEGAYAIKLVLEIAKNGTVRTVVAESAPTPEVKSRIEQQAQDWIFEPYLKDGVGVNVKLSTIVHPKRHKISVNERPAIPRTVAIGIHTNNHAFSSANITARRIVAISFRKLLISSSLSRR
jgi:hypothetical protein